MKAVEFKDQNMVFTAPSDMTDEQCESLPAKAHDLFVGPNPDDIYPVIDSVYELDSEDMALIKKTGRIRLTVFGRGMPPVSLRVEEMEDGTEEVELSNGLKFFVEQEGSGKIIQLPKPTIILT